MLYDDHLRKHLKSICPPETFKICLYGDVESENAKRYPAEGHFLLWENEEIAVPNGLFLVGFYNKPGRPLKTDGPKYVRVQRSADHRQQDQEQAALGPSVPAVASRPPELSPQHQHELSEVELDLRRASAEFTKHRMAVAMQRDAIGLAKANRYSQELAESAALNRTYRTEMEAMAQTHSNLTSRHVEHGARLIDAIGATSQMLNTVIANLQQAAEKIGHPPPAPIDYSDTILKGLGMVGGFALQLIGSSKGQPAGPTPPAGPEDDSVEAVVSERVPEKKKAAPPKNAPSATPRQQARSDRERGGQGNRAQRPGPAPGEPKPEPRSTQNQTEDIPESTTAGGETKEGNTRVVDDSNGNSALDFFLDPANEPHLDDFLGQLQKFGSGRELEQLLALRMPHLIKRSK